MEGPVIFSYALTGPRAGQPLSGKLIARELRAETLAWVHLDATHADADDWLAQAVPYLDHHAIGALTAEETRPRATQIGEGMLVILRGINLNEGAEPEDMVSIRLWIDRYRIISLRRRRVRAALDIEERIRAGRVPDSSGAFLALLADRLTTHMEPVLSDLDEITDEIEERVMAGADPDLRRPITDARRRAIHLRRFIGPQRDAVAAIRNVDLDWIDAISRRRLWETTDRLTRLVEELDAIRERCLVVKDELANALADRLNRNTYVLGVIAAIFLPLGFLTGLLGINVGGIPGADVANAFWIFSGILVIVVAVQVAMFRWLRWF